MKNLIILVTTTLFCVGCAMAYSTGVPMDGSMHSLPEFSSVTFAIPTDKGSTHIKPFICYLSSFNPGRKESLLYSTYGFNIKTGNFITGIDQPLYLIHDTPTISLYALKGDVTDPQNGGRLFFKYLDGPAEVHIVCQLVN